MGVEFLALLFEPVDGVAAERQDVPVFDLAEEIAPLGRDQRPDLGIQTHIVGDGEDVALAEELEEIGVALG